MTTETPKTDIKQAPMSFRIAQYIANNPKAKAADIAKALGTSVQYVYTVVFKLKNKAAKTKKNAETARLRMAKIEGDKKMVRVYLGTSNTPTSNAITMSADEVTNLTPEQKERLIASLSKPRTRMQSAEPQAKPQTDAVNHPAHYKVGGIETIDFIEAKKLNYNLGNVVKYITRADHKANREEDLMKARWYLNREIAKLSDQK